jgi:DNA-binding NarL/FixJ family response regulator
VLSSLEGFEVVAVAADGQEAVRESVLHRPDVALMDLRMPGTDGFTAIRELARVAPDVRVCVLTMYDDDDSLFAAMRAGAHGYLLKGAEQDEIARAVRAIAAGEVIFGPGIAVRVLHQLNAPPAQAAASAFPELTARELEILDLLAAATPTGAIARRLEVSTKTVSNHVSNILAKLQVADRTQAALKAREAGLGRDPGPG